MSTVIPAEPGWRLAYYDLHDDYRDVHEIQAIIAWLIDDDGGAVTAITPYGPPRPERCAIISPADLDLAPRRLRLAAEPEVTP